jgi:hypothetical protein
MDPKITGQALLKTMARITGTCLKDIKGDARHLKNGLPTRDYIAAHLMSREGMSPVNATNFAEATDRIMSAALQSPAIKVKK